MERLKIGERVLYGDFGEGTIVKMGENPDQVVVAFSEVETFDLPTSVLSKITNDLG